LKIAYFEPPRLEFLSWENDPLKLESGESLDNYTIAFESYGTLNSNKDNVILIFHSFTSNTHVTRAYPGDSKPGWWEMIVGPNRVIDTTKYFVLCSNVIGGCNGSTGPSSINPVTKKTYGMTFPHITIKDMVNAQVRLLKKLGIEKLYAIAGGSMGGMQALQFAVTYPKLVDRVIVCASSARWSPHGIAMNAIARQAIMADPNWNNGDYYNKKFPLMGMKIARMIAETTFFSWQGWNDLLDKRHQIERTIGFGTDKPFTIERFLNKQATGFAEKFDPNSYIYLSRALDQFDIMNGYPSLSSALSKCKAKFLLVSNFTDGLCTANQVDELVLAFKKNKTDYTHLKLNSADGHDSFLTDPLELSEQIYKILEDSQCL